MLFIYRFLINLIFILSPLIISLRLIKKKEDIKRFKEKFCFFTKKRVKGNLIWFHGASVGEIKSIVPVLEKIQENKNVNQILITSNTLSSSKIVEKLNLKKITHQFFPIDTNYLSNVFLNYWRPSLVFFIDSEIWPNTFLNLKKKRIPVGLVNGRITKKTFQRWKMFPNFSEKLFNNFSLCLSSSIESKKFLQKLGAKNVKFIGNLKFTQSNEIIIEQKSKIKKFFSLKKIWCASSTHDTEEYLCGKVHKELKKKYKNLLTIIIPRHIERLDEIKTQLHQLNLKTYSFQSNIKISKDTDIFIVDTYGRSNSFYNYCKTVFLGGSIINHGGQNPLEAARHGCKILHGPNVNNFKEIYKFLKKNGLSKEINNQKELIHSLNLLLSKKTNTKIMQKKIVEIGQKILKRSYEEINLLIKNEI
tara:strand:+ start:1309 stop:2562 length:1254 start_codon:yes stop_codon:yes gene_type:complete